MLPWYQVLYAFPSSLAKAGLFIGQRAKGPQGSRGVIVIGNDEVVDNIILTVAS